MKISQSTLFSRVLFFVLNLLFIGLLVFLNSVFGATGSLKSGNILLVILIIGSSILNIFIHVFDFDVFLVGNVVVLKRMGIAYGEYERGKVKFGHYGIFTKIFSIYKVKVIGQRKKTFHFRNLMYRQTLFFKDLDYVVNQIVISADSSVRRGEE